MEWWSGGVMGRSGFAANAQRSMKPGRVGRWTLDVFQPPALYAQGPMGIAVPAVDRLRPHFSFNAVEYGSATCAAAD
jgi:hypothetical protein